MVKSEMECLVDAFIEYLKSVKDYSENTVGSYKHDALLFVRFLEERGVHNITEVMIGLFILITCLLIRWLYIISLPAVL